MCESLAGNSATCNSSETESTVPGSPSQPAYESLVWTVLKWGVVFGLVILFEFIVWRGNCGFTGFAVLTVVFTGIVLLTQLKGGPFYDELTQKSRRYRVVVLLLLMLMGVSRLIWLGSELVLVGLSISIIYLWMSVQSVRPTWSRLLVGCSLLPFVWCVELVRDIECCYSQFGGKQRSANSWESCFSIHEVWIPIVVIGLFSGLFLNANPQARAQMFEAIKLTITIFSNWVVGLTKFHIVGWMIVGLLTTALTSKWLISQVHDNVVMFHSHGVVENSLTSRQYLYRVWRNTLISVSCVFAVYLVIEIVNICSREFPIGFYYAGYAHRGAAWLTVALVVSTLLLSIAFPASRPAADQCNEKLKRISWAFIALNFILALTVYRRMWIYVDYNGLSHMRMIGILGATCVVAGLVCVIRKINERKSFVWLVSTELLIATSLVFVFTCCPIDWIVHKYNSGRWASGDLKPIVQVAYQELSVEGLLAIWPLLDSEDKVVRKGAEALVWDYIRRDANLNSTILKNSLPSVSHEKRWQQFQGSVELLTRQVQSDSELISKLRKLDSSEHEARIKRFRDYTYQWY